MPNAYSIKVRGVVQGVGFRPFVYRLARANDLKGWVLNAEEGVEIHLEGEEGPLQSFLEELKTHPPQAAAIAEVRVEPAEAVSVSRNSRFGKARGERQPTVRISPDLPVVRELPPRTFRSARSSLSLSLYQLHELRSSLQCDSKSALRPPQYHDGRLAAG